jgi:Cu2+-exporting ATPase
MASTAEGCELCDLPLSGGSVTNDAGEQFCCRGCKEIHAELAAREDLGPDDDPAEIRSAFEADGELPEEYETTFLRIDGMHCATCETFLEVQATEREGVGAADASYITDTVRVGHEPSLSAEDLCEQLTGFGYRAYPRDDPLGERRAEDGIQLRLVVGAVFGMMVMLNYITLIYPTYFDGGLYYPESTAVRISEMLATTSASYIFLVTGFLTSIVLFYTGAPILKGAYVSARMQAPNMDLLVALAATSAWLYSTVAIFAGGEHIYYDVSVGIILVVTAGGYYENRIKRRATDRLADLTEAQVDTARRYGPDGSTETVDVDDLATGDRLLVREGERVPVDGTVAEGQGTVDEAVVTGESLPVGKTQGDQAVGGSLLQGGSLVVTVGDGAESSAQRLTDVVWNLQSATHGIQQLADKLATIFVPLVLALAAVVGVAHFVLGASVGETVLVALTVLIVSCPCALGLATPLAIAASVREALERGIVVFDETIFERLREVDVVAFDKTGTLTTGEMRVIGREGPADAFERAALLEDRTSHPIAEAISEEFGPNGSSPEEPGAPARADGGVAEQGGSDNKEGPSGDQDSSGDSDRVLSFESLATGVSGTVDDHEVLVGNPALFDDRGWDLPDPLEAMADEARATGNVPVIVGADGSAEGIAVVGDDPREGWEDSVASLAEEDVEVAILTGDDRRAATAFEEHDDVDHVFAGVPPEAKAETMERLGGDGVTVMVGDGTNDAPALAAADLGIALGSGTALAADAADVAIVTNDLGSLSTTFDLAAAANRRVKGNIGWALLYNAVAIPLAITGLLNPLFAAVAMAASSLLVVTNSSRPLLE